MTEEQRLAKNKRISQTKQDTLERHKDMVCKCYTCKIHEKSLSKKNKELLDRMFLEAKWLKNYILAWSGWKSEDENYKKSHSIFKFDAQGCKTITKKNAQMEDVPIELTLHSMIKDQIKADICSNIKTIHTLKQKGIQKSGGALKFVKEVNYIPLKKYGFTHKIKSSKRVTLPGLGRKGIIVNGLNQFISIPEIEICNARLIRRGDGLFIQFVTYQPKETKITVSNGKTIGIDFGCSTSFTTSEGEKIDVKIRESERLKKYQRSMAKKEKGSKNWQRELKKVKKEYQKITNRKEDTANKIVAHLKQYETIIIQDEQLSNWQKNGHGRAVQHSVLGRVKSKLKTMENVVILSKNVPTTKMCTKCGQWHDEIKVWDRVFKCDCGVLIDRDIHAAQNMVWFYENQVGVGRPKFKRVEIKALCDAALGSIAQLQSMKHEDARSLA
jgi:transposase